jgi:hypothetical protein
MDIISNIEDNTVTINGETISIDTLLEALPSQTARYEYLLNEIYKVRKEIIDQVGNYNRTIAKLTIAIAGYRRQLDDLEPTQLKEIKYVNNQIMQISKQIVAMKELRHGTKLLAIQEGKILADLEDLKV